MLNGGSMVWGFCVYFVYMIPLETDVLRKHRFQKWVKLTHSCFFNFSIYLPAAGIRPEREQKCAMKL